MSLAVFALVVAGAHLAVEVAKYVVKKTKSTKDDKVVKFIADNEAAVLEYLKGVLVKSEAKPGTEARKPGFTNARDHRDK